MRENRRKGIALAVIAAFMWGIMGIFVRGLTAVGYGSMEISFLRCLLAGLGYMAFVRVKNPGALKVDAKKLLIAVIYGIVAYGVSFVSYNVSVSRIPVAVATVLMFMSPVWVSLISVAVFHEKIRGRKIAAIGLCMLGAALTADLIGATGRLDVIGLLAGVINGFGAALQIMIPRYFSKHVDRDTMLVYGFLGSAAFLMLLMDPQVIWRGLAEADWRVTLGNIFGISILCTMVSNVAYVKSTMYVNATTTSILSALEVVVGSAVGFLLFQERMGALQILGAVIIVGASLGTELSAQKERPTLPEKRKT